MQAETQRTATYVVLMTALLAMMLIDGTQAAANAGGGSDGDVCRSHTISQVSLQNSGGDVVQCQNHPEIVNTPTSTFTLSAALGSPPLQGSNPTLTLTLAGLNGCTATAPTTFSTPGTSNAGPHTSGIWTITLTSHECRAYVEGRVTSGSATIYHGAISLHVRSDPSACSTARLAADPYACTLRLENQPASNNATRAGLILDAGTGSNDWLLNLGVLALWIAYTAATRRIQNNVLRIVADLLGFGVLLLPVAPRMFLLVVVAQTAVIIFDLVRLITSKNPE
jgi:hypothetical protein